jgi:hypothetical protein
MRVPCCLLALLPFVTPLMAASTPAARELLRNLPLHFEPRPEGYVARAPGYSLALLPDGARLRFRSRELDLRFAGAAPGRLSPRERGTAVSNYLLGADPSQWRSAVPHYAKVRYEGLYPGITVDFYGAGRTLEYDVHVAPGADPAAFALRIGPDAQAKLQPTGDLLLALPEGEMRLKAPVSYQQIAGRHVPVQSRFQLDGADVRFSVGAYDTRYPLTIDPVLAFASYLGGNAGDSAVAVAIDPQLNIYVTGHTLSPNFPTSVASYRSTSTGSDEDIFVTKLTPSGNQLVFSTYIGGSGSDRPVGFAVDSQGNIGVAGNSSSTDFPTAGQTFQPSGTGIFLTRLRSDGAALLGSTFLGGISGAPSGILQAMAADAAGNFYLAGYTSADTLPVTEGVMQTQRRGNSDAFVARINPSLSTLLYCTYLGGALFDQASAIVPDSLGNAWITGHTSSTDFPLTAAGYRAPNRGDTDAFVVRMNNVGTALVTSAIVGGAGPDFGQAITLGPNNSVYIAGLTLSSNFPTSSGVFQPLRPQFANAGFITRLNQQADTLVYSTYLGSVGTYYNLEAISSVLADSTGAAYIAGYGTGNGFPTTTGALQTPGPGAQDGFLARLTPAGDLLNYGTYLGGANNDAILGMALDAAGNVYLAGSTISNNFPSTAGTLQRTYGGAGDGFVAKVDFGGVAQNCTYTLSTSSQTVGSTGGTVTFDLTAGTACPWTVGSSQTWAVVTSAASGVGNTTITVRVDANPLIANRQANILVGPRTFTITQTGTPCTFTVDPGNRTVPASGGALSYVVTSIPGCTWPVTSNSIWIRPSAAGGNGTAQIFLQVDPNVSGIPRTASFTIAGQGIHLLQSATSPLLSFEDVALDHPFSDHIYLMRSNAIADFCGNNTNAFCPETNTTRAQMALYLIRGRFGDSFTFPSTPYFTDVRPDHPQFAYIQKMRELGYTNGCTATTFCPADNVTRGQMAAFIIRTVLRLRADQAITAPTTPFFTDVPATDPFFAHVQKMRELGITGGCTATSYCAADLTTKGQMSVFVVRSLLTP